MVEKGSNASRQRHQHSERRFIHQHRSPQPPLRYHQHQNQQPNAYYFYPSYSRQQTLSAIVINGSGERGAGGHVVSLAPPPPPTMFYRPRLSSSFACAARHAFIRAGSIQIPQETPLFKQSLGECTVPVTIYTLSTRFVRYGALGAIVAAELFYMHFSSKYKETLGAFLSAKIRDILRFVYSQYCAAVGGCGAIVYQPINEALEFDVQ